MVCCTGQAASGGQFKCPRLEYDSIHVAQMIVFSRFMMDDAILFSA